MQDTLGLSPVETGLVFLPMIGALMITSTADQRTPRMFCRACR
jgi:hypothetical protein